MYKIVPYSDSLDLEEFYSMATNRGFYNNNSKQVLVDTFSHCDRYQTWILYYNNRAVGSVSAHSLEELGILGNSYRIGARLCSFDHLIGDRKTLRTRNTVLVNHQSLTSQFLVPICIEWAGRNKDLYLSTNENKVGTQRLVHQIACPVWKKIGILEDPIDLEYRNTIQSFWKVNVSEFYKQLKKYQWLDAKLALREHLGYDIT